MHDVLHSGDPCVEAVEGAPGVQRAHASSKSIATASDAEVVLRSV